MDLEGKLATPPLFGLLAPWAPSCALLPTPRETSQRLILLMPPAEIEGFHLI